MNEQHRGGIYQQDQRYDENRQGGMESASGESAVDGTIPNFIGGENSIGRYLTGGCQFNEHTHCGKILQRLQEIEVAHDEYVSAHQHRLQARLDESKKSREEFFRKTAELKRDIYTLALEEGDVLDI